MSVKTLLVAKDVKALNRSGNSRALFPVQARRCQACGARWVTGNGLACWPCVS